MTQFRELKKQVHHLMEGGKRKDGGRREEAGREGSLGEGGWREGKNQTEKERNAQKDQ